jgi:hypothetical protein
MTMNGIDAHKKKAGPGITSGERALLALCAGLFILLAALCITIHSHPARAGLTAPEPPTKPNEGSSPPPSSGSSTGGSSTGGSTTGGGHGSTTGGGHGSTTGGGHGSNSGGHGGNSGGHGGNSGGNGSSGSSQPPQNTFGGGTCAIEQTGSNTSQPITLSDGTGHPNNGGGNGSQPAPGNSCNTGGNNADGVNMGCFGDEPRPDNREETGNTVTPPSQPPKSNGCCGGGTNLSAFDFNMHWYNTLLLLRDNWLAALMYMTEQFSTVMMQQMFIVGTFMDAKNQLESQLVFQKMTADIHATYKSDFQLCRFGTDVRSLAYAERQAQVNAAMLSSAMMSRDTLTVNSSALAGDGTDIEQRLRKFTAAYCSPAESQHNMGNLCAAAPPQSQNNPARTGNDLDFQRMVDAPYTIPVDFTNTVVAGGGQDPNPDPDQQRMHEDIIALSKNLYASRLMPFIATDDMRKEAGISVFHQLRSVQAIRSVAQYSFASIVGMKAKGATEGENEEASNVTHYLQKIIEELSPPGTAQAEIERFLGKNPSYYAQMEVLTRKMFQNPNFYVNLYTSPQNVERTSVAMQAVRLMQDRDRFESSLRREMLISLILELKIRDYQETVNNLLQGIVPSVDLGPPK